MTSENHEGHRQDHYSQVVRTRTQFERTKENSGDEKIDLFISWTSLLRNITNKRNKIIVREKYRVHRLKKSCFAMEDMTVYCPFSKKEF